MSLPHKMISIAIVVAVIGYIAFWYTDNDWFMIGVYVPLLVIVFINTRKNNATRAPSNQARGTRFNAYFMLAIALGMLAGAFNFIYDPGSIHPRSMVAKGILLFFVAVLLAIYAIRRMAGEREKPR